MAGKLSRRCWQTVALALASIASLVVSQAGSAVAASGRARPAAARGAVGQARSGSAVPWRQVGPGWVLAMYWPGRLAYNGTPVAAAPVLYLFDPAGHRYRLYRWPATTNPPFLAAWSGDKTRVLVSTIAGALEQLVLATGKVTRFRLPGQAEVIGYTRPRGMGLLGWRQTGSGFQIARYRLDGRLAKVLMRGASSITAVYSPAGTVLAVGARHGVAVIRDDGASIRRLYVPGTDDGCFPMRWWTLTVILASCQRTGTAPSRLWLIPASGSRPVALTPQRGTGGPDPGDLDAWRLRDRLYLQALTPAGAGQILRQAPGQPTVQVKVPGGAGNNWILTARARRLLLGIQTPCFDSSSLLWFNPVTGREHMLLRAPRHRSGVLGADPYGQPRGDIHIAFSC